MKQAELDLLTQAALAMGQSVSEYVREAVRERIGRDGFEANGAAERPRGKPKKQ